MRRLRFWIFACLMVLAYRPAQAHESRPAYLEFAERASGGLDVVWKRPLMGDMGVRLVPHLSPGLLDAKPADRYANGAYLITTWHLPASSGGLSGKIASVEGLEGRMTDVLVKARFANMQEQQVLLKGTSPSIRLDDGARGGLSASWPQFVARGIAHILAGADHLLFVLGLVLIVSGTRALIATITSFTAAHSISLAVATLFRPELPSALIELLIALSILFLAAEVVRAQSGRTSVMVRMPWLAAFAFGILHGLGFAGGLTGLGLQGRDLAVALLGFNVGVEIGQLAFVSVVLAVIWMLRRMPVAWPRPALKLPAYVIGVSGAAWTIINGAAAFTV